MIRLMAVVSLAACVAGCVERASREARCERPSEPAAAALDVKSPAAQQHLREDARAAEALAVSYADSMEGIERGGHHRQSIERCEAALLGDIARVHHVAPDQVRVALGRQNDTPF